MAVQPTRLAHSYVALALASIAVVLSLVIGLQAEGSGPDRLTGGSSSSSAASKTRIDPCASGRDGANGSSNRSRLIPATSASNVKDIKVEQSHGRKFVDATGGSWLKYEKVLVGKDAPWSIFAICVAAADPPAEARGGVVEARVGAPDGPLVSQLVVGSTGGLNEWVALSAGIAVSEGSQPLFIRFCELGEPKTPESRETHGDDQGRLLLRIAAIQLSR